MDQHNGARPFRERIGLLVEADSQTTLVDTIVEAKQAGALVLQRAHLVPQYEDLEVLVAVAWSRADDQVDEERQEMREHEPEYPLPSSLLITARPRDAPHQGRS